MHATTLTKKKARCGFLALLTLAIGAVLGVPHALADSRKCTPGGLGCASFKHRGNTFDVCDYGFDGLSVAVQRGNRKIIAVNYWGSLKYNGCRRWHVRGRNGTTFKYRVCLARNARPGGKPIELLPFYCSKFKADIF